MCKKIHPNRGGFRWIYLYNLLQNECLIPYNLQKCSKHHDTSIWRKKFNIPINFKMSVVCHPMHPPRFDLSNHSSWPESCRIHPVGAQCWSDHDLSLSCSSHRKEVEKRKLGAKVSKEDSWISFEGAYVVYFGLTSIFKNLRRVQ